ncbi:MAG: SURF1 family cytochrome oxidase biogenesis protein [Herbiconiux sp.]|nr:SURF1 family cytochrome oxidase biogenesis protein [Herbiconiux sp.]
MSTQAPTVTVFQVMRRPRWIAMLVLALAVAAGFAALGQWQLSRAVSTGSEGNTLTETVRPLDEVADPQKPVLEVQAAQRVETAGRLVASGYDVLAGRLDDGLKGYWVIGQVALDAPADTYLAVALGWTADADVAVQTAERLRDAGDGAPQELVGRYLPTEAPSTAEPGTASDGLESLLGGPAETTLAVASLVNRWPEFDAQAAVYGGYLVLDTAPEGLTPIASPEPDRSVQLNWLNIFYAAEWVVFAGFAVYLWYRLVRDAWEREQEELAEAAAEGAAPDARVG